MSGFVTGPVRLCLLLMLVVSLVSDPAFSLEQVSVKVFTDLNRYPAPATDTSYLLVKVYDLAAPRRITQALSVGLPTTPEAALAVARERFQANQGQASQHLINAYQSHLQARRFGLTHYPALVFNEHEVIYGISDVQQGLGLYQHWLESRQP